MQFSSQVREYHYHARDDQLRSERTSTGRESSGGATTPRSRGGHGNVIIRRESSSARRAERRQRSGSSSLAQPQAQPMAGSSFRPRMDYLAEDEASDEIVTEFRNSSSSSSNEEEEISRIALGEEDEEVRTLAIFRLNKYSLRKFCNSNIMQFEKKEFENFVIRKLCYLKM